MFERSESTIRKDRGFRDAATGDFLSFSELKQKSTAGSWTLSNDFGIGPRQTVAIVAQNSVSYPIALMAASHSGATVTTLPGEAKQQDLAYFFHEASVKLVFSDIAALTQVQEAAQSIGLPSTNIIVLETGQHGQGSLDDLISKGIRKRQQSTTPTTDPASCAFLAFTSGTTSKPKAVSRCSFSNGSMTRTLS